MEAKAINGVYPFPCIKLAPYETGETSLYFSFPFVVAYFLASPSNSDNVYVDDILIGERSLMLGRIPLEMFYSDSPNRLTLEIAKIQPGILLKIKLMNVSKEPTIIRITVFGTPELGDC